MTDVRVEKMRVHNDDGSVTDIIKTTRTRHTWFGDQVTIDVKKEHHTAQEIRAQEKANMIAGGAILIGTLVVGAISAFFGNDDD